jgi:hypothetical protein
MGLMSSIYSDQQRRQQPRARDFPWLVFGIYDVSPPV